MEATAKLARPAKQNARKAAFVAFAADKQTEEMLQRFVLDNLIPYPYIGSGNIVDAIEHMKKAERSPTHLVVDLSGITMPVSDIIRLAELCQNSVTVIAIGDRNDVGLFRNLIKLGVSDYLVKPLNAELLQRALSAEPEVQVPQSVRTGKTVSFIGTRGGVGVTSVAVHLARYLADETHRRVAYADLDPHGGMANTLLNLKPGNGLIDLLENADRLDQQFVESVMVAKSSRLYVASAAVGYDIRMNVPQHALTEMLEALSDSFHYVFVDLPQRAGPLVDEVLDASKRAYMLADRSVYSARESRRMLRYVEDRKTPPAAALLLNNPVSPIGARVEASDFTRAIGRPILQEVPFDGKALSVAENLGEDLPSRSYSDGFAGAIAQLAANLTGQQELGRRRWYSNLLKSYRKR